MTMTEATPSASKSPRTASIKLNAVTLRYPIGPHVRGSLKGALFSVLGMGEKLPQWDYVTALKDVNLGIQSGERLGIIGANGSGKSSLLRAIAGVYPISNGEIRISGKIQSFFELGVGFEAEATGRQNITFRGLVMGVAPEEIKKREQEIIDFADIGDFIDLPMRMYSSGMWARLTFAISTYLDGDIVLIDEFFGAGDAAFKDKAVNRMRQLVDNAGIVVMVSHDLALIESVCTRCIWLHGGQIIAEGHPSEVAAAYLKVLTAA